MLKRRRSVHEYIERLLEPELGGLAPEDRALCQELVYGVVRWQKTLDWLIARKTGGREQLPLVHILLQLGLYQLFWLERSRTTLRCMKRSKSERAWASSPRRAS